ncbi:MFS transporter [Micromonospora sp. NPDC000316]|uniref:MFS transporter n=1 Tax=Micromonospora sp. NPDC000316 TaxID=3364216 RepID=UPI003673EB31
MTDKLAAVRRPPASTGTGRRRLRNPLDGVSPAIRKLLVVALLTNTGRGVWVASFVLFFTRSVGMSLAQVGLSALIAGIVGIAAATPVGMIADRAGMRRVLLILYLISGTAMLLYLAVGNFWSFVAVGCLAAVASESSVGVRTAVIAALTDEGERIRALAHYRVVSQLGMAGGAGLGALVIQVDSRTAYVTMLTATAAVYLLAAVLVSRLPKVPASPRTRRKVRVLRDRTYLCVTALLGLLTFNWSMLSVGIPLWVAESTDAPRWISGAILTANTIAIALLQVRFSRSAETVAGAARAARTAGVLLGVACVVTALTSRSHSTATLVLLAVAAAVHILGELLYVAASWGLTVGLMPADSQAEYQGMAATGTAAAQALGPLVMTAVIMASGWGWLALGGLFVAAGIAIPLTVRAATTRS